MADAPALLQCCFLLSGTYKSGQTQTSMQQRIFDLGGTVSNKYSTNVTHLLCNDAEFAKRSAKVKAVLAHNAREDVPRIWIIDQAWLEETEENQERPLEEEWDLELNLDEEDAQFDEEERQERAKKAEERKRKREEELQQRESQGSQEQQGSNGAQVDETCELAGKAHVHAMGNLPMHTYLTQKDTSKGTDKTYTMQVLKSDTANMYWVFTRSGRAGGQGKNQISGPYGQPTLALAQFEKKFKDKTKLTWKDRWCPTPAEAFTVVEPVKSDDLEFEDAFDLDDAAFAELEALEAQHQQSQSHGGSQTQQSQQSEAAIEGDEKQEDEQKTKASDGVQKEEDEAGEAQDGQAEGEDAPPAKKARVEEVEEQGELGQAADGQAAGTESTEAVGDGSD